MFYSITIKTNISNYNKYFNRTNLLINKADILIVNDELK